MSTNIPLTLDEKFKLFGRFSFTTDPELGHIVITDDWVKKNITTINIPQLIGILGNKSGNVQFNRKCVKQLCSLFESWEKEKCLKQIQSFSEAFQGRFKSGSTTELSSHAFGIAIDLIVEQDKIENLIKIAESKGFYSVVENNVVHFEICKLSLVK